MLMTLILTHIWGRQTYAHTLAHIHLRTRTHNIQNRFIECLFICSVSFSHFLFYSLSSSISPPYMHLITCTHTLTHMHQHTCYTVQFQNKSCFRNRSITARTPYSLDFIQVKSIIAYNDNTSAHKSYVCVCVRVCIIGKQFHRQQNVNMVYQDSCSNRISVCITISDGICETPFGFFVSISSFFLSASNIRIAWIRKSHHIK